MRCPGGTYVPDPPRPPSRVRFVLVVLGWALLLGLCGIAAFLAPAVVVAALERP